MSKKKIVFVADSTVQLYPLYSHIKKNYEIIWIVYFKDVADDLRKKGVEKESIFLINSLGFLNKRFFPFLVLKKIIKIFFGNLEKKILLTKIKKVGENFYPNLWITDTGLLSEITTKSPKCNFKHSISYLKCFLADSIFNYDYIFLPGHYHLNRILEYYKNNINKEKLIVAGSLKVSNYVRKRNLEPQDKKNLLKKYNLSIDKKNILFAVHWNSFGQNRFLPKSFGDQFKAINQISDYANNVLNCNFIIKLHHYQHSLLKSEGLKKIAKKKNNMVFQSAIFHDIDESEDVIRLSDIIITDTSGVGILGVFLDKKIIYLEPDPPFNWQDSDIKSDLRPGFVCKKFEEVYNALDKYLNSNNLFNEERKDFIKQIFFKPEKDACGEISKSIDRIINLEKPKAIRTQYSE